MQSLLQPCKSLCFLCSSQSLESFTLNPKTVRITTFSYASKRKLRRIAKSESACCEIPVSRCRNLVVSCKSGVSGDYSTTRLPGNDEVDRIHESEELGLLNKPNPRPKHSLEETKESVKVDNDEILEPFMKFFKPKDKSEGRREVVRVDKKNGDDKIRLEYYEPKPGDFVVGVVVSGNENKLDVNIGADLLGTMLTKEVLPLYDKEIDYYMCDLKTDVEEFMVHGKMGIVKDDEAMTGGRGHGRPVVEIGTVLFAEVLGRTLSGRPLLSSRRIFRRIAWDRVRQIKQLNEPIEVKITEWNTGGLLTRIEGLRAFLPKAELVHKVNSFTELKENVGRRLFVQITRINEDNNDLILSEKAAWEILYLREGTLLDGTVVKIFPYGAQIKIGTSNRSGLLHVSNISCKRVSSVSDLLKVDEKVKVLVIKSMFPEKISLSIADLESEPGLFLSNREKVFSEAEQMANKYRQKLYSVLRKSEPSSDGSLPFHNEASLYANWKWFKFETENEPK